MKQCNKCGEVKPLAEFHKNAVVKSGYGGICKACRCEHNRQYAKDNETCNRLHK